MTQRRLGGTTLAEQRSSVTPVWVFREYYHEIRRGLGRLGVPNTQLDDATQDTFLVVHRKWGEFQNRSSVRTWLWAIARRVASEYRRKHTTLQDKLQELAYHPLELPITPERLAQKEEASRIVIHVLNELKEREREIMVLVGLEGFSVAESASLLGVPPTTAYSRYDAARLRFQQILKRLVLDTDGEDDED